MAARWQRVARLADDQEECMRAALEQGLKQAPSHIVKMFGTHCDDHVPLCRHMSLPQ